MRAAVLHGPRDLRIESVPEPQVDPDGIVLRVLASGICGSDLHAWRDGRFVRPGQILGHEFAGEIVEVGSAVEDLVVGDRVTALPFTPCARCRACTAGRRSQCEQAFVRSIGNGAPGAFAEQLAVPGAKLGSTVYRLPAQLDPVSASLVEPLAVALHAAAAIPEQSKVAVVLGLGAIGLLSVFALRERGVPTVIGVDPSARRRDVAASVGAHAVDPDDTDPGATIAGWTGPGPYGGAAAVDAVLECAGRAEAVRMAPRLLRPGGRLVLVGLYGTLVELPLDRLVRFGISLVGSFGYEEEFARAVELIAGNSVPARVVVSHERSLIEAAEAFELQADPHRSVKVVLQP